MVSAISGVATPATGTAPHAHTPDIIAQLATPEEPTNNTTVQHRDPEGADRPGDLRMVQGWLSGQMGEVLIDCTDGLAVGRYDACDRLDQEYPDWLGKYVDVADETENDRDDEAGPSFERAGTEMEDLSDQVKAFRETLAAYEEAREAGNQTRARRLAHELGDLANAVNRTAPRVTSEYYRLTNTTNLDLTDEAAMVERIRRNITAETRQVQEFELTPTNLSVTVRSHNISFSQPFQASGRLTANDTRLADRRIRVEIGPRTITTLTNATGGFHITYRPVRTPINTSEVTIRYLPDPTAEYRRAHVRMPINLRQVAPVVEVAVNKSRVSFGEQIAVTGKVSAGNRSVANVPLVITTRGHRSSRSLTSNTGEFEAAFRIHAQIASGTRTLIANIPWEGRAIGGASGSTPLTVESTATTLSLNASAESPTRVRVQGQLQTADGRPVGHQPITIRLNGSQIRSVSTTATGRFTTTIAVPSTIRAQHSDNMSLKIALHFSGEDTNLDESRAQTTVILPPTDQHGPIASLLAPFSALAEGGLPGGFGESVFRGLSFPVWVEWMVVTSLLGGILLILTLFRSRIRSWWHVLGESPFGAFLRRISAPFTFTFHWIYQVVMGVFSLPTILRRRLLGETSTDEPSSSHADGDDNQETASTVMSSKGTMSPIEIARSRFDSGDVDEAIELIYREVRSEFASDEKAERHLTHWEFFQHCRANGFEDETIDTLERLTETYEHAAFSPTGVPEGEALQTMELAESVLSTR